MLALPDATVGAVGFAMASALRQKVAPRTAKGMNFIAASLVLGRALPAD